MYVQQRLHCRQLFRYSERFLKALQRSNSEKRVSLNMYFLQFPRFVHKVTVEDKCESE